MKKLLVLAATAAFLTSCGYHEEPRTDMPTQDTTQVSK